MSEIERMTAFLDEKGVSYVLLRHAPAVTMELCRGIGAEYGARHCKNLFLANKHGSNFFLLLMDPDKPYRTSSVSRLLGSTRLSFGSDVQLDSILGAKQGSVSVMALTGERAKKAYSEGTLHIVIDASLLKNERICVHPNDDTATLVMRTEDVLKLVSDMGYEYSVIEI